MKSYKDLVVWQKSMSLVTEIYKITRSFPKEEMYGLVYQIRRCAISIASNIAEGYGRQSTTDYVRYLQISRGSLYELQTQLEVCVNIKYVNKSDYNNLSQLSDEIGKMLNILIKKVKESKKGIRH